MIRSLRGGLALAVLASAAVVGGAAPGQQTSTVLDPDLRGYQVVPGVRGNLTSVGSDTLNPLIKAWAGRFKVFYPEVGVSIEGKGSNTAPPALISGAAQISPMSRAMQATEIEAFEKNFGYKPRGIRAAVDAICVIVHKDNPLACLRLDQADAVFSKAGLRGGAKVTTWKDLGLEGSWAKAALHRFGRNELSGTHVFFKSHVLKGGEFSDAVHELEGSAAVVDQVASDPFAIGYCGIGYVTGAVRTIPLSAVPSGPAYEPTAANAYAGDYPLSRILFVYFNLPPRRSQDPLVREFIRMVCSREGQEIVLKEGYFPMPAAVAREELAKAE